MITHVKFVSVPCRDQDRALESYTTRLGFDLVTDQPMGEGRRWIELRIGRAETRFVLFTPTGHEDRVGGVFNGAFATDNVERTYEALKARGVEFKAPPEKQPWGTYAIFRDSEGNEFVLSSPR
ncbi:MAG TPA: VOC family protein [Gemmatimonadales bacterium]|nr:VOC family protein [Gemmatimonadales bacterium]